MERRPQMKKIELVGSRRRRSHRIGLWSILFAVGLSSVGCYPKAGSAPTALSAGSVASASARWPGATAASLEAGRDAFIDHCNACHSYPDLAAIGDERWPGVLAKMGKKAHLTASETEEVLHFILASRAEQAPR
jgi:hypothetical protein